MFLFAAPFALVAAFLGASIRYTFLGIHYDGSPFAPLGLLMQAVMLFYAFTAYTLLWGRWAGVRLGLACGYAGLVSNVCVMAMVLSRGDVYITLEPLLQIPFIIALTRLRRAWEASDESVILDRAAI